MSSAAHQRDTSEDRLEVVISRQEIAAAVERLATEVRHDYLPLLRKSPANVPLLVAVLKGAFMFLADLIRALDMPLTLDFVRVSTYGAGTRSSGMARLDQGPRSPIKGRHVLLVEDIVDTGVTTGFLLEYLCKREAASVKLCSLLSKPARRKVEVDIDYLGFTIPDMFIVGYGTDYAQQYRNLPDICVIEGM